MSAYTSLVHYFLPEENLIPLAFSLLLAGLFFFCFFLLTRHRNKACTLTSFAVILFFGFDSFLVLLKPLLGGIPTSGLCELLLLFAYIPLSVCLLFCIWKIKGDLAVLTINLNFLSLFLLLWNLAIFASHQYKMEKILQPITVEFQKEVDRITIKSGAEKPDIFYIILDGYARCDTLKDLYGYESLFAREGKVSLKSTSNYPNTSLSLASALNMQYLDFLKKDLENTGNEQALLFRLIQNNKVQMYLKRLGYSYINIISGFSPTDMVPEAINIGFPFGNVYYLALLRNSILGPLQPYTNFSGKLAAGVRLAGLDSNTINQIEKVKGPRFVLMHITVPHRPYIFKSYGSLQKPDELSFSEKFDREKYVEQVKFIEQAIGDYLHRLNTDSKRIIIIQSDHGSHLLDDQSQECMKERYGNLTKVISADKFELRQNISSVNVFRDFLRHYFGANLEELPDKCYYAPDGRPMDLKDITELVR